MRDTGKGGKKPIEELNGERPRKAKLERVSRDVGKHQWAEEKLIRLNKILKTVTSINQDIFLIKDRRKLLEKICERIVEYAYKLVWIGFCDEKTKRVIPETQAGFEEGYLESVKITYDDTSYGCGPTGTAIRTKKPNVMQFISTDPRYEPWREAALKRGYHSSAAIPIFSADEVVGALNVYSDKEDAFGSEEVELLEELAHDISTGLRGIDEEIKRKRAEEALQRSRKEWESTFNAMSDWVCVVDLEGTILQSNRAGEKFTGVPVAEIVGQSVCKLVRGLEEHIAGCPLVKMLDSRQRESAELQVPNTDKWLMVTVDPVKDEKGELAGAVHIVRDVTKRKRAEEKLIDYQAQLKSLASQLTLAEERERRRIAVELHDRISQTLAICKLELDALRTSASCKNFPQVLDEVSNSLGKVIADTRSLTFDLSFPLLYEAGFEVAVAAWLTEQIEKKYGIATEFKKDKERKLLDDDVRVLLFRSVQELLINAVKHSQAKKVTVSVSKVGDRIHVSVEDDGVGFNVKEAAGTVGKTGGFGLFSIRERLEEFGGHFEIESEPGKGTKVTLIAPLKQSDIKHKQG